MFPLCVAFFLGRCSLHSPPMVDTSTQKDQPIIPKRLREELKKEKALEAKHLPTAREARSALSSSMQEVNDLRYLV